MVHRVVHAMKCIVCATIQHVVAAIRLTGEQWHVVGLAKCVRLMAQSMEGATH